MNYYFYCKIYFCMAQRFAKLSSNSYYCTWNSEASLIMARGVDLKLCDLSTVESTMYCGFQLRRITFGLDNIPIILPATSII